MSSCPVLPFHLLFLFCLGSLLSSRQTLKAPDLVSLFLAGAHSSPAPSQASPLPPPRFDRCLFCFSLLAPWTFPPSPPPPLTYIRTKTVAAPHRHHPGRSVLTSVSKDHKPSRLEPMADGENSDLGRGPDRVHPGVFLGGPRGGGIGGVGGRGGGGGSIMPDRFGWAAAGAATSGGVGVSAGPAGTVAAAPGAFLQKAGGGGVAGTSAGPAATMVRRRRPATAPSSGVGAARLSLSCEVCVGAGL